jgi:hypothetical protein
MWHAMRHSFTNKKRDPERVKRLKVRTPTIDDLGSLPNLLADERVLVLSENHIRTYW